MIVEKKVLYTSGLIMSPTRAFLVHAVNAPSGLVKTVSLRFFTGDLWKGNPDAHLWVMVDGYVAPGDPRKSLKGRGIAIGHTPLGTGVAFEHFGASKFMVGEIFPWEFMENEYYDIVIECHPKRIEWGIAGPDLQAHRMHYFISMAYQGYDTVIGVAGNKYSGTFGLSNVVQTLSDTGR